MFMGAALKKSGEIVEEQERNQLTGKPKSTNNGVQTSANGNGTAQFICQLLLVVISVIAGFVICTASRTDLFGQSLGQSDDGVKVEIKAFQKALTDQMESLHVAQTQELRQVLEDLNKQTAQTSHDSVLPILDKRDDFGKLLNSYPQFTVGVELGVQLGIYSKEILSQWTNCEKYHLVDAWQHQDNYHDLANVNDEQQNKNMEKARANLQNFKDKVVFHRNFTTDAVKDFEDKSVDFVYIDARHDYKGVKEDMKQWWPKLRVGGIFAGHDFEDADEAPRRTGQDWSISADGTSNGKKAVKSAVEEFAKSHDTQHIVTRRENKWVTWYMHKLHE